jgi:hypothetical protein
MGRIGRVAKVGFTTLPILMIAVCTEADSNR